MRDATKGMLAVFVGVGSLAIAVGAWLAPTSIFRPSADIGSSATEVPRPARPTTGGSTDSESTSSQTTSRVEQWDALAAKMDRFLPRSPRVAETPPPPPPGDGDETGPDDGWRPSWIYEGYVGSETRPAALVTIAGMQQFIFVGDEISDPGMGTSAKIRIDSIEPERIRVSTRGMDGVVDRSEPQRTTGRVTPTRPNLQRGGQAGQGTPPNRRAPGGGTT